MTALHSLTASQLRSLSIVTAELVLWLLAGTVRQCRYQLSVVMISCPHNYRKNSPARYLGNNADRLPMSGVCLSGGELGAGGLVCAGERGRGEG